MTPNPVRQAPEAPTLQTASLILRGFAFLLDALILGAIVAMVVSILGLPAFDDHGQIAARSTLLALILTGATYHILFLGALSTTPGKMAMGLYVGDRDGQPLRPDAAILRYLVLFAGYLGVIDKRVAIALSVITLLSIVMALIDRQHRALHDRVAGTRVLAGRAHPLPSP